MRDIATEQSITSMLETICLRPEQRSSPTTDYETFLRSKLELVKSDGFALDTIQCNPILKPHQRDIVQWAVNLGRAAIFASFGLGKTLMQLEIARIIVEREGGRFLIVAPLGVKQEFMRDAKMLGVELKFVRRLEECGETGIYITNYETVRDGKLDPTSFIGASLDEAAVLRGFGGVKTFRTFMAKFAGDDRSGTFTDGVKYRFVATATPSPNEYIELLAYAAYLGIMDVGQGKTRFFKRDATKADKLTLHAHKEREWWVWVASWAIFLQKPSDLGYSDEGYSLPDMEVHWHELPSNHATAIPDRNGQGQLFKRVATNIRDAAKEKRESIEQRIEKMVQIVRGLREKPSISNSYANRGLSDQFVVWAELNDEQNAVDVALRKDNISYSSLYGAQDIEDREALMTQWRDKETSAFVSKSSMYGAGINMQQSHTMIFLGINFKFAAFIQSLHRVFRFLQQHHCHIHIIYTEAEREVRRTLERKWSQHKELVKHMTDIIREYGLSRESLDRALQRSIGCERIEVAGERWKAINNDSVYEMRGMEENSIHHILTSIPFSTQYEYTPSYNDLGHNVGNAEFWQQMDFLTPHFLRVLQPGRICAIHIKDRIIPGGINGLGFQTVYPCHVDAILHYTKHGFSYMGMKTIVTDVVRENNQTYRLGWTEQCKDGTKMGVGMPEYLLIFRKPPSSTERSYADTPVIKNKGEYSRARWQTDAHGFARSSGNRLIQPEDIQGAAHNTIFQLFKEWSLNNVYDYEHHVKIGEDLELKGMLPPTFMLLQPQSWSDEAWTDVTRMLTLNGAQSAQGREMHLCPMQFDIADRCITQYTMPGEVILDPFSGIGSVPYRAVLMGRHGVGIELNARYFMDGVHYLKAAEIKVMTPTLFDLITLESHNASETSEEESKCETERTAL